MSIFSKYRTVRANERVVEYVDGTCTRVLGPGKHAERHEAQYESVYVLDRIDTTAPQEILTADGMTVRVTAAIRWRISDPQLFLESAMDPAAGVYLAVQVALRDALVGQEAEALASAARLELGDVVTEAAVRAATDVGIEVRHVVIKDIVLPPELRAAYAQLATAKLRGQAQLEAARAETAALRSLANGAKLLDESPALAKLRLVQSLPHGSTVKLTTGD
jgi:regulator of protease activity HflC (stomatin/prohibitin superfamily)